MDAERLRQLVRNLQTHLQIAATFSDRERTLQTNLDALREKHRRFATAVIADIRRLRAIEEAARDIAQVTEERDDPWVCVPITARQWDALKAALAAKGEK
jgi:ElaB/YqjD/DUF883 family membrane-anchored ribosome-binding protein